MCIEAGGRGCLPGRYCELDVERNAYRCMGEYNGSGGNNNGSGGSNSSYTCDDLCRNVSSCCERFEYDPEGADVADLCGLDDLNSCLVSCENAAKPNRNGNSYVLSDTKVKCLATTCNLSECYTGVSVRR